MKIKTSELTDAALDWAVTKCEGNPNGWCGMIAARPMSYVFKPSTNWSHGGPIIEREKIWIQPYMDTWISYIDRMPTYTNINGPTPLIAAMRVYVASKLGDEVDVPDELEGKRK